MRGVFPRFVGKFFVSSFWTPSPPICALIIRHNKSHQQRLLWSYSTAPKRTKGLKHVCSVKSNLIQIRDKSGENPANLMYPTYFLLTLLCSYYTGPCIELPLVYIFRFYLTWQSSGWDCGFLQLILESITLSQFSCNTKFICRVIGIFWLGYQRFDSIILKHVSVKVCVLVCIFETKTKNIIDLLSLDSIAIVNRKSFDRKWYVLIWLTNR